MWWGVVVRARIWFHIAILCGIWDPFGVLWVGDIRDGMWIYIVVCVSWVVYVRDCWHPVGDVVL